MKQHNEETTWSYCKRTLVRFVFILYRKNRDTTTKIFLIWIYASALSYISLSESAICLCVLSKSLNYLVNTVILSPVANQPTVTRNSSKTKWDNCTAWWWAQENQHTEQFTGEKNPHNYMKKILGHFRPARSDHRICCLQQTGNNFLRLVASWQNTISPQFSKVQLIKYSIKPKDNCPHCIIKQK